MKIKEKERVKSVNFAKIVLSIAFVAVLLVSMAPIASQAKSGGLKLPEKEWVDGTNLEPLWGKQKSASAPIDLEGHSGGGSSNPPLDFTSEVGDWGTGIRYTQNFHWVMTGEHCYIYVAYDLGLDPENYYDEANDEYVFENPYYDIGGWTPEDRISTAQLAYLMSEFDSNIYPTMTTTFGFPIERPADETKIYILIMNIRDPSYYDATFTWYVAGYFSYGEDTAVDKNMIHIDSYDWANRIGPGVSRPYAYEGTFTHEFEHLIHQDIDPDEVSWVDEGCADFAIYVCGYGHSPGHIANYLAYHPWTPLTFWGGGLEDYGASYLFTLYLYEHFGGTDFIVDLVYNQLNDIEGVEDTLHDWGYMINFDQVFYNWAIANYIDDTTVGDGEYGYFTLNIPSADTWGYSIQYILWNWWIGTEFWRGFGYKASWWPGKPMPYTANYWEYAFNPAEGPVTFLYGGEATSGFLPYSGDYHFWGGVGNYAWRRLHQTFSIPSGGATLNFYANYEIEEDWDYAYVEVHDLTADTWTTLPGVNTRDYMIPGNIQDNPNCPDEREPSYYYGLGEWNAFTGSSGGYYPETMDLSPFAGHDIELYFVYYTDQLFNEVGMYIDDISIPELSYFDDVETGGIGWTNEGWTWASAADLVPHNWEGAVFSVTGIDNYRLDQFWVHMRSGRLVNFEPGKLHFVWSIAPGALTIPIEYINIGHLYVAVFFNAAPHNFVADYWFGAY